MLKSCFHPDKIYKYNFCINHSVIYKNISVVCSFFPEESNFFYACTEVFSSGICFFLIQITELHSSNSA